MAAGPPILPEYSRLSFEDRIASYILAAVYTGEHIDITVRTGAPLRQEEWVKWANLPQLVEAYKTASNDLVRNSIVQGLPILMRQVVHYAANDPATSYTRQS